MRRHLVVVGHGFRFYGALIMAITAVAAGLLAGLSLVVGEPAVALLAPIVAGAGLALGVPYVAAGRGMLNGRPWARLAGIALSCLMIGDFPIGMSLGVLGLGVLLDEDVASDFRSGRLEARSVPLLSDGAARGA